MNDKVNRVFFLGAGFSMALAEKCVTNDVKYPSLKTLTNQILNNFSKSSLNRHLDEISPNYKTDIEELLSYLLSDLPWQNPQMKHLDKALYFELVGKIANYFNKLDKDCEYDFTKYAKLSSFIMHNKIPIVTLNYDTLLEKFLLSNKSNSNNIEYRYFYNQVIYDLNSRLPKTSLSSFTYGDATPSDLPTIHKLHGSINWLWSATNPSDPIYCKSSVSKEDEDKRLKQERQEAISRKDLTEYIIPPVLDKTHYYNHNIIKSIWADAYKNLVEADEVYIVGFSFPLTDISVKFLFNSAFSHDNKVRKIFAINTKEAKNCIKERYDYIFGQNKVNYDYCCDDSLNVFVEEITKGS